MAIVNGMVSSVKFRRVAGASKFCVCHVLKLPSSLCSLCLELCLSATCTVLRCSRWRQLPVKVSRPELLTAGLVIARKTYHTAIVGPPGSGGPDMLRSKSISMGVGVPLGVGMPQQIRMAGDYASMGSISDMTMQGNGLGGHLEPGPICKFAPGSRYALQWLTVACW